MTKIQKETAERLAELLVQSSLSDSLKELLIDKVSMLPENLVFELIDAFQAESDQLEIVAAKVTDFINAREEGWYDVENDQRSFAQKFLESAAQGLDDQARIQELKESI